MKLLPSLATVGGFTIGSRLVGFVREMVMASLLGAGPVSDAFIIALKLPSVFRRVLAEGAMNAAFVPLFSGRLAVSGDTSARSFAEEILAVLTFVLVVLILIIEIFLPQLVPLFVPGFKATPERLDLAIEFCRITFPFIFLISLTALYSGILNSYEKFAAVASSPMAGNLAILITVYGLLTTSTMGPGQAFAYGILMCGVVQLAWVVIPVWRQGIVLRWAWPRWSLDLKQFLQLMTPALAGSGVVQLSILIDTLIASKLPAGGISYLHYADRLNQLPLSVLGTAVGTALLPLLSKQIRNNDTEGAQESQNLALEYTLLFTLPATLGLIVFADLFIQGIYQHHHFSAASTWPTAQTLMGLAAGLPAYVLIKIFTTSFFARRDTKTPVLIAIFSVAMNVIICLSLLNQLQHVGIALAAASSAWINALLLGGILYHRQLLIFNQRFLSFLPRILSTTLLSLPFFYTLKIELMRLYQESMLPQPVFITLLLGGSLVGFFGLAWMIKAFSWQDLKGQFHSKTPSTALSPSAKIKDISK